MSNDEADNGISMFIGRISDKVLLLEVLGSVVATVWFVFLLFFAFNSRLETIVILLIVLLPFYVVYSFLVFNGSVATFGISMILGYFVFLLILLVVVISMGVRSKYLGYGLFSFGLGSVFLIFVYLSIMFNLIPLGGLFMVLGIILYYLGDVMISIAMNDVDAAFGGLGLKDLGFIFVLGPLFTSIYIIILCESLRTFIKHSNLVANALSEVKDYLDNLQVPLSIRSLVYTYRVPYLLLRRFLLELLMADENPRFAVYGDNIVPSSQFSGG